MVNYIDSYSRSDLISEVLRDFDQHIADQTEISVAGRVMAKRVMGKAMFFTVFDGSATIQVFADVRLLGKEIFSKLSTDMKIGFIIGISGQVFLTRTQEKTIACRNYLILTPSLRPLPEKFHGLSDLETRYRQRYLDLIINPETREIFRRRSIAIKYIREYLNQHGFVEVETPIFQRNPCGASADPFVTHHDAKDIDLFLRISPETFLKQLIVGGMDRVYEIGKNFRNEGVDASHLQEFTMLEYYVAYWNYDNNIEFTKNLIERIIQEVSGRTTIEYQGAILDFSKWQEVYYREAVLSDCGIDVLAYANVDHLKEAIARKSIDLSGVLPGISLGSLIDKLYKKVTRPRLIQPTILKNHPAVLIPLARLNDKDIRVVDSFQVLVNGWEIAKGYSELADPNLQRHLLERQLSMRERGDHDAMFLDTDFLTSLEYGMPPVSGVGIGIDRFVALLTDQRNLTDVILFPLMK